MPDQIIDALRSRGRDGALNPPKRGPRAKVSDLVKIAIGPFVGHLGVCAAVSRGRIDVLLFMLGQ